MTIAQDYLLEVGTEELPASFLASSKPELLEKTQATLEKNRLTYQDIQVLQTPRRLALIIKGLQAEQSNSEELLKGPPANVGLDAQGNPTPAAIGFAKKVGIEVSDLKTQTIDGTAYLTYLKQVTGKPATQVLAEILPEMILSLTGSHFMAWDESQIRFSRPIRWILSLYGDQVAPLTIGLKKAGNQSFGNRFFATETPVTVPSVSDYANVLNHQGKVIVDPVERASFIQKGLYNLANELNGMVPPNPDLLETVTMLVETPALISGNFDPQFLALPKEVITTVMAAHQKYFPVEDKAGKLMPLFITVSNNPNREAKESIQHGNEKVLRARLEDANFFFQEDRKHSLSDYAETLAGMTFQKGLGTMADKSKRVSQLTQKLGQALGWTSDLADAEKAAQLCKADLATHLVRELTELQGIIGKYYARLDGQSEAVAQAIEEHYLPRGFGDSVAQSKAGILVSLADKFDTLLAVFAQKEARYPTGSKDPMGLRRMTYGIIQTVLQNKLQLNLDDALTLSFQNLGPLAQEESSIAIERTKAFIVQRLKGVLLDKGYAYDWIDAILGGESQNLPELLDKLATLKTLRENEETFKLIYEPANRTARILGDAFNPNTQLSEVQAVALETPEEKALFTLLQEAQTQSLNTLESLITAFKTWAPIVNAFFDKVLVNAEDPTVKQNRYTLLSRLNTYYRQFADFTQFVI